MVYVAVLYGISATEVKIDSVTEAFYLQILYNCIIMSFIANSGAIAPCTDSGINAIQCIVIPIYRDVISPYDQTMS
jgi:hypothetical protein